MSVGLIRGHKRHLAPPHPGWQRTDPLDRGLIAEWRFDPPTGSIVPDFGSKGLCADHADIANGTWVSTPYGIALLCTGRCLSGLDCRAGGTGRLGIHGLSAFTMEAFYRFDGLSGTFELIPPVGFYQTAGAASAMSGYYIRGDANPARGWTLVTNNTKRTFGGTAPKPSVGEYIHATMVYDGSDLIGYREGANDGSTPATGTIDSDDFGRNNFFFNFLLVADNHDITLLLIRLYNRALYSGEVRHRYEICLKRAQAMTHVWMIPLGMAPVAAVPMPILSAQGVHSIIHGGQIVR